MAKLKEKISLAEAIITNLDEKAETLRQTKILAGIISTAITI